MSSYRDDMNDTAVISDKLMSKLRDAAEATAFAASVLFFGLYVGTADAATVSDEVVDTHWVAPVTETAKVSDQVIPRRYVSGAVVDTAALSDQALSASLGALTVETATISDAQAESFGTRVTEFAAIGDGVVDHRIVHQAVSESAKMSDSTGQAASALIDETAAISDTVAQVLSCSTLVAESATSTDELLEAVNQQQLALSTATASDEVIDRLYAVQSVADGAVIEDVVLQSNAGQAWTADAGSWAMSRYAPFTAQSLVVINGVLHAAMQDGVYALDADDELISSTIETGRMSFGDSKATPLYAYMEYELDGTAEMSVTQSGAGAGAETFIYPLAPRASDADTSGRFIFGKGLRDKRFAFRLDVEGLRCEVYGLSIDAASLKRKV
jgi:hypothetical protein